MSESHYIRRRIKAASEHGTKMARVRWKRENELRDKLAALTAEMFPSKIVRRIIVIDEEKHVKEAVIWSFDSARSAKRKVRQVLQ